MGSELLELLLLSHRKHWLGVGIQGRLPPKLHLIREETPLPALDAQLGGVHDSRLHHHRELVGSAPAFWFLLRWRHYLALQPPGLRPFVEGDRVDAQLL